jgi:hypothetical protein
VRALWSGEGKWNPVEVDAEGLDAQPKAWRSWDYASLSFLWQRQLGQALDGAGFAVQEAPPGLGPRAQARAALGLDLPRLLGGDIETLSMDKRGADSVFSTNFTGTFFTFFMMLRVRVTDPRGRRVLDKSWTYRTSFFDPTRLGRPDKDTFPVYFARGLAQAAQALAQDPDLRTAVGLPAVIPSPAPTPPAADQRPYWIDPKTGQRMDPSWNFDPSNGMPRKDFVLVRPAPPKAAAALTPAGPSAVSTAVPGPSR